jgi:hypothetical protein
VSACGNVSEIVDDAVQNHFDPVEAAQHGAEEIVQDVRPAHADTRRSLSVKLAGGGRNFLPGSLSGAIYSSITWSWSTLMNVWISTTAGLTPVKRPPKVRLRASCIV